MFLSLYDFTKEVTSDFTLYAKYTLAVKNYSFSEFSIKLWNDYNSKESFNISPYGFDLDFMALNNYKIKINVEYDVKYTRNYPWDLGYAGPPKYEFSIENTSNLGFFEYDLKSETSYTHIKYSVNVVLDFFIDNSIFLIFSTNNIQNYITFDNVVVTLTAYK